MNRLDFINALGHGGHAAIALRDLMRFINEAVTEFHEEELWPWRLTSVDGPPPLTVANLGPIEMVQYAGNRALTPREYRDLHDAGVNIVEVGDPLYYYVISQADVHTWPVPAGDVQALHYTLKSWGTGALVAASDADTPTASSRWHDAILLLVQMRAARHLRDFEAVKVLRGEYELRLAQARESELYRLNTKPRPRAAA